MDMLTVGGYYPIAGRRFNTIRRASPKYADLRPGTVVRMIYCEKAGKGGCADGDLYAIEDLKVASIVTGTFAQIIEHHWTDNHGSFDTMDDCDAAIRAIYGDPLSENDPFMAIYFV